MLGTASAVHLRLQLCKNLLNPLPNGPFCKLFSESNLSLYRDVVLVVALSFDGIEGVSFYDALNKRYTSPYDCLKPFPLSNIKKTVFCC